jgi:hypothetical protein
MREYQQRRRAAKPDRDEFDQEPDAPDIPALTMGRARKVRCPHGHTFIYATVPETCPAKGCGARLEGK